MAALGVACNSPADPDALHGSPGPLDAGEDTLAIAWVPVGKPVTWGYATLSNTGPKVAVLEQIEVLGVPRELTVLDVTVSPHDRPHSVGIGRYPVKVVPSRPVRGALVQPAHRKGAKPGVEVLVGLESSAEGDWETTGLRVSYRVGGKRYVEVFGQAVGICSDQRACSPADRRQR